MTPSTNQKHAMHYAKFASLLYLIITIFGGFSIGHMPSVIIVAEDASQTAQNMVDNLGLFQLGILGDIVVLLLEVILTAILYRLTKRVNKSIAMIACIFQTSHECSNGVQSA